jgi:DNA replication protein DnaC
VLDAVVEQHLVVLGKTGTGKTYAAKGIAERLLRRRQRVCIVDPTGVWWGLKATADRTLARAQPARAFRARPRHVPRLGPAARRHRTLPAGRTMVRCDTAKVA